MARIAAGVDIVEVARIVAIRTALPPARDGFAVHVSKDAVCSVLEVWELFIFAVVVIPVPISADLHR